MHGSIMIIHMPGMRDAQLEDADSYRNILLYAFVDFCHRYLYIYAEKGFREWNFRAIELVLKELERLHCHWHYLYMHTREVRAMDFGFLQNMIEKRACFTFLK